MRDRRFGRFFLANKFLEEAPDDLLSNIFKQVVILKADRDYMTDRTEYWAYCNQFRPSPPGEITPFYEVNLNFYGTHTKIEFKEKKETY